MGLLQGLLKTANTLHKTLNHVHITVLIVTCKIVTHSPHIRLLVYNYYNPVSHDKQFTATERKPVF